MNEGDKFFPGQKTVDFEADPKGVFLADILAENFDVAENKIKSREILLDDDFRRDLLEVAESDTHNPRVRRFIKDLLAGNDLSQEE